MTISRRSIASALAVLGLIGAHASGVSAGEIKALITIGVQSAIEDLAPKFEQTSGHKLTINFGLGNALSKRVQDGEAADLVISTRAGIDGLIKGGKVAPGVETTLARSGIGIAVRKGATKPDISTADALKSTLLAAKSISYTDPAAGGASGVHFGKVLERLGIAEEMKGKTKHPPPGGFTAPFVASGEVEIAVQQIGELISVSGVEFVGPLPGDLQLITVFVAAIPTAAKEPDAAKAFVSFLQSPDAMATMKVKGLEPAAK